MIPQGSLAEVSFKLAKYLPEQGIFLAKFTATQTHCILDTLFQPVFDLSN